MRELGAAPASRVYTAGQVARRLGVPETTLRSWHLRYLVGPHAATPGGYRKYTVDDIARLETMRDLIKSGMLASDAARTVSGQRSTVHVRTLRDRLATASQRLDSRACQTIVAEAVQAHGVVETWEALCRPALLDVEAEQEARSDTLACVPREHVLSWAIAAALHQVTPAVPAAGHADDHPAVLLACTDIEQHALPLDALAAALTERGVPVRMLGAAVPAESLVSAVRSTSPAVVVLWAHRPETANRDALTRLRRVPALRMTAGPGWPPRRRSSVGHLDDLAGAVAAVTEAVPGRAVTGRR